MKRQRNLCQNVTLVKESDNTHNQLRREKNKTTLFGNTAVEILEPQIVSPEFKAFQEPGCLQCMFALY